jgi:hypothetical protein
VGSPPDARAIYQHVEVQDTPDGVVTPHALRGWQLPDRARHVADRGDIFVCRVGSSINKWFMAGGDCSTMRVINGFYRLGHKPGMQQFLPDLIAGLKTEPYRIQARSYCTGSDGLAEISEEDLLNIVLPRLTQPEAQASMQQVVEALLAGRTTAASIVGTLIQRGESYQLQTFNPAQVNGFKSKGKGARVMQEQAIRTKFREQLQSGEIPQELWPEGRDGAIEVHAARGETCAVCGEPIQPPEAVSTMVTPLPPDRVFVFQPSCEALWRDEARRFVRRRDDLPST